MDLYKRIQDLKKQRKVRTATIAHALDMEQSNYVRVEKKGSKLTYEQIEGIAGALGISVKEFLFGENETAQAVNTKDFEDLRKENEINKKLLRDAVSYMLDNALDNGIDIAVYSMSNGSGYSNLPSEDKVAEIVANSHPHYGQALEAELSWGVKQYYRDLVRKRIKVKFDYKENSEVLFYMFNNIERIYDLRYIFNNGFVNDKLMVKMYTEYRNDQEEQLKELDNLPPSQYY